MNETHPMPRHRIRFGKPVDHNSTLVKPRWRSMRAVVNKFTVDLVRHEADIPPFSHLGNRFDLRFAIAHTGWVGRAVENDHFGPLSDCVFELLEIDLEIGVRINLDRLAAGQLN